MWGREMRAGVVFVVVALLAGGGFREWKRSHEVRFQDLVSSLEGRDAARGGPSAADAGAAPASGSASDAGGPGGGSAGPVGEPRPVSPRVPLGMLDPDRADVAQLTRLPGIGPRLAARIVADRDARGPFRAPEALLRVPGIGPRTLERIRGYLRFEPAGERESPSSF